MNYLSLILLVLLMTTTPSHADQVIILKDGSHVRGELVSVVNGIYTVQTATMGQVNVNAGNVVSINNGEAQQTAQAMPAPTQTNAAITEQKFQQMQTQIMSNPAALADIQEIAKDPELMKLLSDPALIQSAVSHDVNGITSNSNTQELLNNPKMKALMEKLQAGAAQ